MAISKTLPRARKNWPGGIRKPFSSPFKKAKLLLTACDPAAIRAADNQ
jgi:hypothetical protein